MRFSRHGRRFLHGLAAIMALVLPTICAGAPNASVTGSNWMYALDASLPLSRLSIPGTHDSGALLEPLSGTARCQDLTIGGQLHAGVRFLDIRCRHVTNAFLIYHGSVDQNLGFNEVLRVTGGFLKANPGECVIMSVKEEYTARDNTRPFEATFDACVAQNPDLWLLGAGIPTLGQARGKIVLFRRFKCRSVPKGIDASSWPDNTTFTSGFLRVQDCYKVGDNNAKWDSILQCLREASGSGADRLHVNFTSGVRSGLLGIPDIPGVATDINSRLDRHLAGAPGRCGVMVMDFVNANRCALVFTNNVSAPPEPR
jgi:1-phosphatidylinositol phosphodiesterase